MFGRKKVIRNDFIRLAQTGERLGHLFTVLSTSLGLLVLTLFQLPKMQAYLDSYIQTLEGIQAATTINPSLPQTSLIAQASSEQPTVESPLVQENELIKQIALEQFGLSEDYLEGNPGYWSEHPELAQIAGEYGIDVNSFTTGAELLDADLTPAVQTLSDKQKEADINEIATLVRLYWVGTEEWPTGLTETFKEIGTAEGNIDLESIFVPDYSNEWFYDPEFGTQENTGYQIRVTSNDELIMQALGSSDQNQLIQVVK